MPKLLPILIACLFCLAGVARAQETPPETPESQLPPAGQDGRVEALLTHGNDAGQFLAVVSRVAKSDGTRQPSTEVRYRPLGTGRDAWVRYALLDARVLALAERSGDLAVLVEVARSGPGRTQLRFIYNPLVAGQGARDVPGPRLPAGETALELAGVVRATRRWWRWCAATTPTPTTPPAPWGCGRWRTTSGNRWPRCRRRRRGCRRRRCRSAPPAGRAFLAARVEPQHCCASTGPAKRPAPATRATRAATAPATHPVGAWAVARSTSR